MTSLMPGARSCAMLAMLAMLVGATGLVAQPAPQDTRTLGLSDAQKTELLSHNSESSVDAARAGLGSGGGISHQVHGEVGVMIGSSGTRGVYGTAAIPLGDNAGAIVSFEDSRYGRGYSRGVTGAPR